MHTPKNRSEGEAGCKNGWQEVRFDQIAENVSDRVDDPSSAGVERYVGLEHLDPESLKIRRWGSPDEVEATKLRFHPGDIVFGKRRAYQRKLAVADFEGICSAHAMVLRAREETVVKEFLPVFMQSDLFFDRALAISVGSLSPTINWKTLAAQEFLVPPKAAQRRISDLLWSVNDVEDQWQNAAHLAKIVKERLLTAMCEEPSARNVLLGEIIEHPQYGLSIPLNNTGTYPIFRMMNFDQGRVVANDMKYVELTGAEFQRYKLYPGDLLFNRTNSADLVGKVGIFELEGDYVFASYLVRLRCKENLVLPRFLNYYLNSTQGQRRILAFATPGVSQTNINAANLTKVTVPLPDLRTQKRWVSKLKAIDDELRMLGHHISRTGELKRRLRTKMLSS